MYKTILLLSIPFSVFVRFFEKYIFDDWVFFCFLAVLVAIDTLLGVIKHWKMNTISSKGFASLFIKFVVYCSILILTHILKHFEIGGLQNSFFSWLDSAMYSAIMLREAISILENAAIISPGLLPGWILSKFKNFDQNGFYEKQPQHHEELN